LTYEVTEHLGKAAGIPPSSEVSLTVMLLTTSSLRYHAQIGRVLLKEVHLIKIKGKLDLLMDPNMGLYIHHSNKLGSALGN
jgi:hypothetical protein